MQIINQFVITQGIPIESSCSQNGCMCGDSLQETVYRMQSTLQSLAVLDLRWCLNERGRVEETTRPWVIRGAVSYTHLTLPTIYSV